MKVKLHAATNETTVATSCQLVCCSQADKLAAWRYDRGLNPGRVQYTLNRPVPRSGVALVEFAVVAVIFFLFLFGIFEYSRLVMVRQLLENAAREGARYSVVHTYDKATSDIQNKVLEYLANQDAQLKNLDIQVYKADPATGNSLGAWTDASFGECIAVQINADYRSVLPTFLGMPDPLPLQVRAIMYSEAN